MRYQGFFLKVLHGVPHFGHLRSYFSQCVLPVRTKRAVWVGCFLRCRTHIFLCAVHTSFPCVPVIWNFKNFLELDTFCNSTPVQSIFGDVCVLCQTNQAICTLSSEFSLVVLLRSHNSFFSPLNIVELYGSRHFSLISPFSPHTFYCIHTLSTSSLVTEQQCSVLIDCIV